MEDFNLRIATLSKTLEDTITNVAKRENYIKDVNSMTKVEIREYFSTIKKTLHDMGIDLTKEATKMLKDAEKSAIASAQRTGKMSFEGLNNKTINETLVRLFTIAESGALKGKDSVTIKNFTDNKTALALLKEINTKLGKQDALESFGYKLKTFFGDHFKETKKNLALFGKDLIEGLAANKFIGGAFADTIRLVGLIGGTFLKEHFGKLGTVLGAGFVAVTQVLSTLLPTILLTGIANILTGGKLFGFFGKAMNTVMDPLTKGILNLSLKANGPLADLATAGRFGQKVVAGGRVLGGVGMALGAGAGALYAGKEAISDWKSGNRGRATSFGIGGLALGAGAIAAVIAGALAPVTLALVGIGAGIVGLTALWKHHSETIKAFFGKAGDFFKKAFKKIAPVFVKLMEFIATTSPIFFVVKKVMDWILSTKVGEKLKEAGEKVKEAGKNAINTLSGKKARETQQEMGENATVESANRVLGTGTSAQLLKGKQIGGIKNNKHLDVKKMTEADWKKADTLAPVYGPMGNILNLGQMSQKRAREVVEADIKAKGKNSFYEKIDDDLLKKGTFETDIEYAARGTSAKVKHFLSKAKKEGFDTSNVKITSAIGTLGSRGKVSPHAYTSSMKGHFNEYGTTVDLSAMYNTKTGKRLTQADLNRMNLGDYWLNSEGDHEHIALGKYDWMIEPSTGAQKVVAQKHSISSAELLARVDKDKYEELKRNSKGDSSLLEEDSRKELQSHQIYYDDARKVHVTQDKKSRQWMQIGVVGGDLTFERLTQTMENMTTKA